jgi:hypothetical protein
MKRQSIVFGSVLFLLIGNVMHAQFPEEYVKKKGETADSKVYQQKLKVYQTKFKNLKNHFQRLDAKLKTKLTTQQRTKLNKKLKRYINTLQLSFYKLQQNSGKVGISISKLSLWESIPTEAKLQRLVAMLGASVDFVVMLAMHYQKQEGVKDKDALQSILNTLKQMENNFQRAKNEKFTKYLEEKVDKKDDD